MKQVETIVDHPCDEPLSVVREYRTEKYLTWSERGGPSPHECQARIESIEAELRHIDEELSRLNRQKNILHGAKDLYLSGLSDN